jgi:predicted outer membrane repeat protein
MRKILKLSIALVIICCNTTTLFATIRYVKPAATGTATGNSWANASADLQLMINSSVAGDEVWVAAGTYKPSMDAFGNAAPGDVRDKTFYLQSGVKVYGGFAGTETLLSQRPAASSGVISILSGDFGSNDVLAGSASTITFSNYTDNAYHIVLSVNDNNATLLDGFTVKGGNADGVGTVTVDGRAVPRSKGGAMHNEYSQSIINNCIFIGNNASSYGGAVYNNNSSVWVTNAVFDRNNSNSAGGALCSENASNGQVINAVFIGNKSSSGGTIFNYNASPTYFNCTLTGNSGVSASGGFLNNTSNAVITNCIFWNTTSSATTEIFNTGSGAPVVTYSITLGGVYGGTGNSSADPKFSDLSAPAGADGIFLTADDGLQLTNCSGAYNKGTAINAPATDILGVARPQYGVVDMGAYENATALNEPPAASIAVTSFSCTSATLLASGGDSYSWNGGATPAAAENIFTAAGTYTVISTNIIGCTATASSVVTFGPTVSISGSMSGCGSVTLTASGAVSYLWSGGNTPGTAANTFTASGNYTVTATGSNSCTTTAPAAVTVTIVPLVYVNTAVAASGDGSSWATAFKTLQEAINVCGVQEIWVAAGTYIPTQDALGNAAPANPRDKTFCLKNGTRIYGGFAGTETLLTQRDPKLNKTTLSGDFLGDDIGFTNNAENAYHVVISISDNNTTVLDGFTIRGGFGNLGTTVPIKGKSVSRATGAGMILNTSNAIISNVIFTENKVTTTGGGIYAIFSSSLLINVVFSGNTATTNGGGIFSQSLPLTLNHNVFLNNVAANGAGMYLGNSASAINNCLFYGNTATTNGAAMFNLTASPVIKNSIVWNNTGPSIVYTTGVAYNISYSDIQGAGVYTGTGNLNTDPLFVNAADADGADNIWRSADDGLALQNTSPLMDAGLNTGAPANDITGSGIFNLTKDIGAYEQLQGQDVYNSTAACQSVTVNNVTGNQWFYFRNTSGIVAAINPNGTDMGNVTAEISDAAGAITFNNKTFIGRTISFTCTNYTAGTTMPAAYSLRIYYYDTELSEYNTAAGGAYNPANLNIHWRQNGTGCTLDGYSADVNGMVAAADLTSGDYGSAANGFYLQFALNHFTIFAASAGLNALPVKLVSFTGISKGNYNLLNWITATEINNDHFNVERSTNGITFEKIAAIGGTNNSSTTQRYAYEDHNPAAGANYYRLTQVDIDGRAEHSGIVILKNTGKAIMVYPNPAQNEIYLGGIKVSTAYSITNVTGMHITKGSIAPGKAINIASLAKGLYFITADGEVMRFIKK